MRDKGLLGGTAKTFLAYLPEALGTVTTSLVHDGDATRVPVETEADSWLTHTGESVTLRSCLLAYLQVRALSAGQSRM